MKRRWKVLLGIAGGLVALAAAPILYVETACRGAPAGTGGRAPLIADKAWQRDEARTWLTYPEWHIVYSADSFARHLTDRPPSAYPYWRDIRGFWSGYCAVNRPAAGGAGFSERPMLYTIGLSFSAELLVKAAYENTLGRITEAVGGWRSADDTYAARVQQRYGAFMHETPWYEFPFGGALSGLWRTSGAGAQFRHWERRLALSAEYGVKAGYATLIGAASGASLGRDERSLRFVARANPAAIAAIDPRLKPVGRIGAQGVVVEAPRYAQFSHLLQRMAAANLDLVEISGNDDIFVTLLSPESASLPAGATQLMAMPLGDRPGWERRGVAVKVPRLLPMLRAARQSGAEVEHVYDY